MTDILLLGRMVEHAEYHSENYGDDFFTFFEKHYGSQITKHKKYHNEEEQEHEELPFQHISCHHIVTDIAIAPYEFPVLKGELAINHAHTFYYQNLYSSLGKVSIFQPPKFA